MKLQNYYKFNMAKPLTYHFFNLLIINTQVVVFHLTINFMRTILKYIIRRLTLKLEMMVKNILKQKSFKQEIVNWRTSPQ